MISSKRRSAPVLGVALVTALTMTACGGGEEAEPAADPAEPAATDQPDDRAADPVANGDIDAICEAGKSEGAVRIWGTGGEEEIEQSQPFVEEYGIELERSGVEIPPRLTAELESGRGFTVDMIEGDFVDNAPVLNEDFLDTSIDWVALGIPETQLTEDGWGIRTTNTARGLAYNPEKFSADEIPDTWEELIDPQWAGRVSVDPRGGHLAQLGQDMAMGPDGSKDWLDRFYETVQPVPIEGTSGTYQEVAADRLDISTAGRTDQVQEGVEVEGLPVAFKALDIIPLSANYVWPIKDSPNRNATLCYIHWWAGDDAEAERVADQFRGNEDVPEGTNAPDGAVLVPLETPDQIEQAGEFAQYIADTFAGS